MSKILPEVLEANAKYSDVARIRNLPLVRKSIPVHSYIYDVAHGKLTEVEGARVVGASA
jgi:carbonic anhydrase